MKCATLVAVLLTALSSAGCMTAARPSLAENGLQYHPTTFVYGDIAFDTALEVERTGPVPFALTDCSTAKLNCLSGDVFTLATPVDCASFSAGVFGEGETRTWVLRREEGELARSKLPIHYYPSPVWLIGSPDRPHIVFVYAAAGVMGLYWDQAVDVVELAREQGLVGLSRLGTAVDAAYRPLNSFQPWGRCEGRIEPSQVQYQGPPSIVPD